MNKKKNLMNLFTQDVKYNYHLVKTEEPNGHLIYIIKNGSNLDKELLEFYPTHIAEELINDCNVKIEKFAPSIFFTEEENTEKLKYELNDKLSEDADFSAFIEGIKDEYRTLELRDSLLYKKDPEAYKAVKEAEHIEHQKELWGEMAEQMKHRQKKREDALLAYNNDLVKLLKEYLESIIEYEKRDFNLIVELEKLIGNLIDPETWIKIPAKGGIGSNITVNDDPLQIDVPFVCRIEPISLEIDKMNVFLTDNNDYSYTATLRFDKTVLITENIVRINKEDALPECMHDYKFLAQLYDVDTTNVTDWEYKNDTDRFEYVIDYLSPIFKVEKERRQKEIIDKVLAKKGKTDVSELEDEDFEEEEEEEEEEEKNNKKNMKHLNEFEDEFNEDEESVETTQPSDWYFDVSISEDSFGDMSIPSCIALSRDGGLDDQLGSHSLSQNIIDALNRAGIFGDSEMMESIWEVNDYETKTKEDIIKSMKKEGFQYSPGLF